MELVGPKKKKLKSFALEQTTVELKEVKKIK